MLGPFGETLVVDWGLALPLERVPEGHESTQGAVKATKADSASLPREQGEVVGTLAYMPPEQAEGAIDKLGPRSDVYGLGAILYALLTGKHPVEGTSLEEVLRRVGQGEIKPPRQVRPEVPAPLEAVCLKALALRPEDRYPTPRSLAADIKSWLADEPVTARPEPFAERARRWAKRNRTAVTAAAASLLVGLVGLGAVAAVLIVSNIALDKERLRAEDREAQAIAAVRRFSEVIADDPELKNTEELKGLRKRLLNEPLAFFRTLRERLQADRDTRPESLARLAEASFNLGHLTYEIGDQQDALIAYRESLAIRRKLADANPTVNQFQSDLAFSHNNIGVLLGTAGKPAEALKAFEEALAIRRKLADANPTVNQFQSDLAVSHYSIGVLLLRENGKPAEALKAIESALAIRRKLAEANPTVNRFQRDLAGSHNNIGILLTATGKPAEAMKAHESALTIQQKLAREHPESSDFASDLGGTLSNLAIIDLDKKRFEDARVRLRQAVEWQRKALASNPANPTYRRSLTIHFTYLITAARGLGDSEGEAEAERELAKLRDSDPAMVALDARLSAILRGDQQPTDNPERLKLAQRAYEKALHAAAAKLWTDALDADPKLAEDRRAQHRYNAACAAALAGCGQGKDVPAPDDAAKAKLREQARAWLQAELAIWTKFVESGPAQARPFIVRTLQHWREDSDLAGVREPKALESLPEAERESWRALWAGVDALLTRAQAAPALAGGK